MTGGKTVGGIDQVMELTAGAARSDRASRWRCRWSSPCRSGSTSATGAPAKGWRSAIGNAGRAIPELALIAFMAAVIGVGLLNLTIALAVLGIPPILTNTFVGIRQVDRATVDAARGMGMTELEILRKVEVPLAVPTIISGVRGATIEIVATATIAPLAGVLTLGDFIINRNVYGDDGVLAGAILVALLALALEFALAGLQRLLTSTGLKLRTA